MDLYSPSVYFPFACCPTCGDRCGQGAVIHGAVPYACCHQFAQMPFLTDAEAFVEAFKKAKIAAENYHQNKNVTAPVTTTPAGMPPEPMTMGAPSGYSTFGTTAGETPSSDKETPGDVSETVPLIN